MTDSTTKPGQRELDVVREADGTQVVQLTRDNGPQVWEWADSKPFYSPGSGDGLEVTGLAVFTPTGRVKAEFGDFITCKDGQFGVRRQPIVLPEVITERPGAPDAA